MPVTLPPWGIVKQMQIPTSSTSPHVVGGGRDINRRIILTTQEVQQKYEKWTADSTTLEIFLEDDPCPIIQLDQEEQMVGSWKILPLSSPPKVLIVAFFIPIAICYMFQISKAAIKNYHVGKRIPHCGIELELLTEQVQRLQHKVDIKGISSLGDNFYLRYPQLPLYPQVGEIIT